MATSARVGEGITLIKPCSDDINKLTESAPGIPEDGNRRGGRRTDRRRRKWRLRGIGSSSLLLILTSILQSAGIGAAALIASSLYGMVTEAILQILTKGNTECMFAKISYNGTNIGQIIGIPYNFILGFTAIVLPKSSMEFICAQAPYNMKGLLIGLSYTTLIFFTVLGTLLYLAWRNPWFAILHTSTCGIWFYLTTLVLAVVSSALLGLVIRWYKARERDEITRSQDLVEEVYHKYHEQASQD